MRTKLSSCWARCSTLVSSSWQSSGAMTQHVLLRSRQLGEEPAIRQLKDWIEAEAAGAARLGGDGSAQDAFAFEAPAIRQGKHRDAMEGRRRRLVRCRPQHPQ